MGTANHRLGQKSESSRRERLGLPLKITVIVLQKPLKLMISLQQLMQYQLRESLIFIIMMEGFISLMVNS